MITGSLRFAMRNDSVTTKKEFSLLFHLGYIDVKQHQVASHHCFLEHYYQLIATTQWLERANL